MTGRCTYFMLIRARDTWDDLLTTLFEGYPDLRMTRFAVGAFATRRDQLLMWQTFDPTQYDDAVDLLQGRAFFRRWFEILDVIAGIEADDEAMAIEAVTP